MSPLLHRPRHLRYRRALSHDQHRLRRRFIIDPARAELRHSVGSASWLQPFANIFGDIAAFAAPRHTARVLAFPGCFGGELAVIKHELAELRQKFSVR